MALKWKGRVRETTVTTGTGALTLGGAVTSYGTFASLMSTGDTCYGTVAHRTTTEWEDCLFTMAADGTLQRTTVIDGSSGVGVAVSLSAGTKDVFLGLPPAIVETLLGASLVTLGSTAYATSERVLTAGSGISLTDGGAGTTITVVNTAQGVTDHGALTGLADDDHTQYALLAPTTDARNVIQPTDAAVKALVLKGAASQSDNLLEWQNSAATFLGCIDENGNLSVGAANPLTNITIRVTSGLPTFEAQREGLSPPFTGISITPAINANTIGRMGGGSESWGGLVFNGFTTSTATAQPVAFVGYHGSTSPTAACVHFYGRKSNGSTGHTTLAATEQIASFINGSTQVVAVYGNGSVALMGSDSATNSVTTMLTISHNTSGSPAAGLGSALLFQIETSTTVDTTAGKITCRWGVETHASREGIVAIIATDYGGDRTGFEVTGNGTATEIGFYGVTPVARPSAYTQTYSTADKTHANPTAAALTVADGAGTNDGTIGAITADASVIAAVQELADQVNKLVADMADVKQLVNSVIDDLQSLGLLQ